MRVIEITTDYILFDNGKKITEYHDQNCCECNFADFMALNGEVSGEVFEAEFKESLIFEKIKGIGFRFGNEDKMFFVPCYSSQNGYYSSDIGIMYDDVDVFKGEFEVSLLQW